ncbi:MAG: hypothetical protein F6K25_09105 [Okeania sp. SIO2G4]|uniref:hypothetical protein n=1 Tax=unclassified Okeania TaxID=2634635 RepID=UPI0013C0AE6B|nr:MULTISPECIES: hypothetical protein [unclassified Okeania]NEP04525.1 hypothetical protein [Okeania sp. SIO4D6]NEP71193.1 hypothetical protein [Okeania sp. SIO2G5]NEQ90862.1 hypothetical protein [Okeania sp. SIO2G4]
MGSSGNFLTVGGENSGVVNFSSLSFSDFDWLKFFQGIKSGLSIGNSEDFLTVGGENSGVVNFSSLSFSDFDWLKFFQGIKSG